MVNQPGFSNFNNVVLDLRNNQTTTLEETFGEYSSFCYFSRTLLLNN